MQLSETQLSDHMTRSVMANVFNRILLVMAIAFVALVGANVFRAYDERHIQHNERLYILNACPKLVFNESGGYNSSHHKCIESLLSDMNGLKTQQK